jgi:hypothetical protein
MIISIGKGVEKLRACVSRHVEWYSSYGKQYGGSSKNENWNYHKI